LPRYWTEIGPRLALTRAGAIAPLVGLLGAESEATQGYADGH